MIAGLGLAVFMLFNHNREQAMVIASKNSIIKKQNDSLVYRKTKEGKIIADKAAAEARAKDLEASYPLLAKRLEQMEIKFSNLKTAIQAEFRAINSGVSTVIPDTIYREGKPVFVYPVAIDDGFLSMKGEVEPDLFRWDYVYTDELTTALHVKKKWIFGNEHLYFSGSLRNPNAKITNSTAVRVQEFRDKRFVFTIGGYYDPLRNQYGPSINFGYKVWAF